MRIANVAVWVDRDTQNMRQVFGLNSFELYIKEILGHAGIPFRLIDSLDESVLVDADVVIAALENDNSEVLDRLWQYAEAGGTIISYGGLNQWAERLGCVQQASLNEVYVNLPSDLGDTRSMRASRVMPWALKDVTEILSQQGFTEPGFGVLHTFAIGSGTLARFGVDIPHTVVSMQQGLGPVLSDGIPAPDGTANLREGILKADDGMYMDWQLDRLQTASGQNYFAHPYADLWREVCIGHLLRTVVAKGLTLPFIGYWPDGIDSVATISHDSDGNRDEQAVSTLEILKELDIRSTWCMLESGYSDTVYNRIREAGHELAFHYNAMESQAGQWSEAEFARQLGWLHEALGTKDVAVNKNHYTRFEGWGELFQWCEKYGIATDQTRGPSKGGNIGFLFGTCHAYFPIAWANEHNRIYDVLEIGFLTQDMDIGLPWSDSSIIEPFLDQVKQVKGIAHFLIHQMHVHSKPQVVESFRRLVQEARKRDFTFWTSGEINDWERRRRTVTFTGIDENGQVQINGDSGTHDVVVWVPLPSTDTEHQAFTVQYGVPCGKQVFRSYQ